MTHSLIGVRLLTWRVNLLLPPAWVHQGGGARGVSLSLGAVVPIDGSSRRVADGSLLRLITRVGDVPR